jgi:hypothetical protein
MIPLVRICVGKNVNSFIRICLRGFLCIILLVCVLTFFLAVLCSPPYYVPSFVSFCLLSWTGSSFYNMFMSLSVVEYRFMGVDVCVVHV